MAWPNEHEPAVYCSGFNKSWLPAIMRAVDANMVEWVGVGTGVMEIAHFDWADCRWEIIEVNERVTNITLISGKPNAEDLTAAVLRG